MNKFLKFCFGSWWRPLLLWFVAGMTFGLSIIAGGRVFQQGAFYFLLFALLLLLISALYHFSNRKWLTGILHISMFGGTIVLYFLLAIAMFFIDQERPDTWADNLTIPTGILIEDPVDFGFALRRPDSVTNRKQEVMDFQLYNSFQPGLFEYDFWTGRIEKGTIYLRAYEITQEYALSTRALRESSAVQVYNPDDSIRKFGTNGLFTIYEGDWGKPYAARFELWFKPDNGDTERVLIKKNYKIEGWMR